MTSVFVRFSCVAARRRRPPQRRGCQTRAHDDRYRAVLSGVEWAVLCSEGYTSSLAAASLLDLGLRRSTDVIGGYHVLVAKGVVG